MIKIKRGDDNAFKCDYEKRFKHPYSLQNHEKKCNDQLTSLGNELIVENVSEDSDEMDVSELGESGDDRVDVTPADYVGTTFPVNG